LDFFCILRLAEETKHGLVAWSEMFCRIAEKRSQPAKDAPRGKQKEAKEWGRAKIRFEKLLQDIQEIGPGSNCR
jgi:hypothetical protein